MTTRWTRRRFLTTSAAGIAAPTILSSTAFGSKDRPAPSERITLGFVGVGGQGLNNLRTFLRNHDAQVVAACDVQDKHFRDGEIGKGIPLFGREPAQRFVDQANAKWIKSGQAKGCRVYSDYRELCSQPDIDAVVISTPDHWHYHVAMEALRQKKDIYGEKPITHFFPEGQRLRDEVGKRSAVFQTGSQQRSMPLFRRAAEIVANGHLGKISRVEVGLLEGYPEPQGDPTVTEPPDGLDYDAWCGPRAVLPYMRARHHRWWRGHSAYGRGTLMDWIGHHNDIAHWSLGFDEGGPVRVRAVNWKFPDTDVYDTPLHFEIESEYPGGIVISISDRYPLGTKWIGDEGSLFVTRGRSLEASNPEWTKSDFAAGPKKLYESNDHHANFLECVRSRQRCAAPAEIAHRSITPGHLGYVSNAVGRPIRWDPTSETIVDDSEASAKLQAVQYREGWTL